MEVLERNGNVTNIAPRDVTKEPRSEPIPPKIPAAVPQVSGLGKRNKIFAADRPQGADALGRERILRPLAELAVHRDCETPLTIALLGPAGSGKSFALGKLLSEIQSLSAGKGESFLPRLAIVRIDAASLEGEPAVALAAAVYDGLETEYPEFVHEIGHAVRDPRIVAREAAERLDAARRRLDAERQKLEEIEGRRARLAETVLFESAGSQVDAYARANRTKIENRLEGFGISGDAIANYKSMVRDVAESGGPLARMGAALRAFWALNGQMRLLVLAAALVLLGVGLNIAVADQDKWLDWLRSLKGAGFGSVADWFAAHMSWLSLAATLLFAGAGLALVANILRGIGFLRPLFRGVRLLEADVVNRRRALDGLYAHQMRRVDGLEAEAEIAARHAAEADRRAGASSRGAAHAEPPPFGEAPLKVRADRFFAAVGTYLEGVERSATVPGGPSAVPQRLLVALDNLDLLPRERLRALLDALQRALTSGGIVALIAADPMKLALATEADESAFGRWIQVPLRLDAKPAIASSFGAQEPERRGEVAPLDWSMSVAEAELLAALAPLAGGSPRAVKRFVNLYRIARSQLPEHKGLVALMLALEQGGTSSEIAALEEAFAAGGTELRLPGTPRLEAALQAVRHLEASPSPSAAERAAAVARAFSLRL